MDIVAKFQQSLNGVKSEFGQSMAILLREGGLKSVTWKQFAPYFNDGDECVFHVRFYDCYVDFTTAEGEEYNWEDCEDGVRSKYTPILNKISNFVDSIPDYIMGGLFGRDHSVTCDADGNAKATRYNSHD